MNLKKTIVYMSLIAMFSMILNSSDKPCIKNGIKLYGKVQVKGLDVE
ncbi:MAG: Unknown protein [uncultured Sulfurovum sp.]|uniref:Uncharacterized protein n=1 Tax=uncultured Sulfurovum sp. TaxID=269237 RepID=A0A6S6TT77_9BACT|nr:MAG: Unknown protein [uncultured Sulfurovum sp.]